MKNVYILGVIIDDSRSVPEAVFASQRAALSYLKKHCTKPTPGPLSNDEFCVVFPSETASAAAFDIKRRLFIK